jgi:mono/diheme cytochrome c family protein
LGERRVIPRVRASAMIAFCAVLFIIRDGSAQDVAATPNKATIEAGERVYNNNCAVCHGDQLVSSGQFPNLRRLSANDRARFYGTVRNGKNQMPPWNGVLSDEEIDQIWSYIRANAHQ